MDNGYQLITRGEEVCMLKDDNEVVTLAKGVGFLAMSLYDSVEQYSKEETLEEKQRLEAKANFQSKCLDSLSRALTAVRPYAQ